MNNLKPIGIKILGDSPVGKTSILNSFIGNAFLEELLPTVGIEKIEKRIKLKNGEVIKLSLWDSSGKVRFREVELKQVRYINGIILVFDFTSKDSFNNINSWISQIKEIAPEKIIVLFGNQIDKEKKEWQVTSEKAKEYAKKMNLAFFETSAKTGQGLEEGFSYIANEIYDKEKEKLNNKIKIDKKDNNKNNVSGCDGRKNKSKNK